MSVAIDITVTNFILCERIEDSNKWLNDNIGKLIHDEPELSYGENWKLQWEPITSRWIIQFDDEKHATLFLLRWA